MIATTPTFDGGSGGLAVLSVNGLDLLNKMKAFTPSSVSVVAEMMRDMKKS